MTNKKLICVTLVLTLLLHLPSWARAEALDASKYTNVCGRTLGFGHINGILTTFSDGKKQFDKYIYPATQYQNPEGLVVNPQFLYNQTAGYKDYIELQMQKSAEASSALAKRLELVLSRHGWQADSGSVQDVIKNAWAGFAALIDNSVFAALKSYFATKNLGWIATALGSQSDLDATYNNIHTGLDTFVNEHDKILISSHSQGSFFANDGFKYLTEQKNYSADDVKVIYAAPVSEALNGDYLLADGDLAVWLSRVGSLSTGNLSRYPPNVHISNYFLRDGWPDKLNDMDPTGHGMTEIYLNPTLQTRGIWLKNYKNALTALVGDAKNTKSFFQAKYRYNGQSGSHARGANDYPRLFALDPGGVRVTNYLFNKDQKPPVRSMGDPSYVSDFAPPYASDADRRLDSSGVLQHQFQDVYAACYVAKDATVDHAANFLQLGTYQIGVENMVEGDLVGVDMYTFTHPYTESRNPPGVGYSAETSTPLASAQYIAKADPASSVPAADRRVSKTLFNVVVAKDSKGFYVVAINKVANNTGTASPQLPDIEFSPGGGFIFYVDDGRDSSSPGGDGSGSSGGSGGEGSGGSGSSGGSGGGRAPACPYGFNFTPWGDLVCNGPPVYCLPGRCGDNAGDGSSGGGNPITPPTPTTYTLGGTIVGLTGIGLEVASNGQYRRISPGVTTFTFPTPINSGTNYNVTVSVQPSAQTCLVQNGSGTLRGNVSNVQVVCEDGHTVGGSISGLTKGNLVLQINGANDLAIAAGSNSFIFPNKVPTRTLYTVTIKTQPTGQICTLQNASGTITDNVSNVQINCTSNQPTITTQPANITVATGQTATFTVVATGGGTLSYQWQVSTNAGTTWTNIAGATSATYTTAAVTTAMNGYGYRVVVTDSVGSITSSSVTLNLALVLGAQSKIAAGQYHTCAIKADGTAVCWGDNEAGQLGAITPYLYTLTPVAVSGLTGVSSIVAGHLHTCALKTNGTVACWGYNDDGQLGDGTTEDRYTPVAVSGLTGVSSIAAGFYHTCALKTDGSVACWGDNTYGQLGDGTSEDRHTPTTVPGLSNVSSITAGDYHTCAVKINGTVACWGDNTYGQLGDGTSEDRHTPVAVSGLSGVSSSIAATYDHTCAVKINGTVACWGDNTYGQLGDGTTTERHTPVAVSGLTGVSSIAAGDSSASALWLDDSHACALKTDNTVACWGGNGHGQLGDGTTETRYTPVTVSGLSDASSIAASGAHVCAIKTNGTMACWGNNYYGQLGDGTIENRYTPVLVRFPP